MLTDTSEPSVSRDKKCERLEELIGRKFFITQFLKKSEEEIMGLENDVLTKKQIMEEFSLKSDEDFISFMEKYHDLWENLYDCGDYDAGAGYGLIPKEKREQFFIETDREIKWLQETMGRNDAKNIKVTSSQEKVITILDSDIVKIHPVQDFYGGKAWTTIVLPCSIQSKNGLETKNDYFLINSAREPLIQLSSDHLKHGLPNGIMLKALPNDLEIRWKREDAMNFYNGVNEHFTFKEVYEEIKKEYKKYIQIDYEPTFDIITAWTIATYFHELFRAFGFLNILAPKGSGKSKTQYLLGATSFNAKVIISATSSSTFRSVDANKETLLIDELDLKKLENDNELDQILRGGYEKGSKIRRSAVNSRTGKISVTSFEYYSPKTFSNATGLTEMLQDRGLPIVLQRANNFFVGDTAVNPEDDCWWKIRNMLYVLMMENWQDVDKAKEIVKKDKINALNLLSTPSITCSQSIDDKKLESFYDNSMQKNYSNQELEKCDTSDTCEQGTFLASSPLKPLQMGLKVPCELSEGFSGIHTYRKENEEESISTETLIPKITTPSITCSHIHNNNNITYNIDRIELEGQSDDVEKDLEKNSVNFDKNDENVPITKFTCSPIYQKLQKINTRNFQITLPMLTIAKLVGDVEYENIITYIRDMIEEKQKDDEDAYDNVLLKTLVELVDFGKWYKYQTILDAIIHKTDSKYLTTHWLGKKMRLLFPSVSKIVRHTRLGNEVYLTPVFVRDRATRNGLDVEEILATSEINPFADLNDVDKIKFKLRTDKEIEGKVLLEWAIMEGIQEDKAEKIIRNLKNEGYFAEYRLGTYKWIA